MCAHTWLPPKTQPPAILFHRPPSCLRDSLIGLVSPLTSSAFFLYGSTLIVTLGPTLPPVDGLVAGLPSVFNPAGAAAAVAAAAALAGSATATVTVAPAARRPATTASFRLPWNSQAVKLLFQLPRNSFSVAMNAFVSPVTATAFL